MSKQTFYALSNLGTKIKEGLSMRGMSQLQLAEKAEITPAALSLLINGKRDIKISTLIKIANALDVPFDFLLSDNVTVPEHEARAIANAYKGAVDDDKTAIKAILHKYDKTLKV
ncbi:MAG: helix-turn-helix transcriptional regulator [Bacteroidaceae bacterium]|nr:helix-turn-helix transcriptional regulator [Bacteroidaceae bacterium]